MEFQKISTCLALDFSRSTEKLDRLVLSSPSLEYRRLRGDMIEVYKITNNVYDSGTANTFFELAENNTTNNKLRQR